MLIPHVENNIASNQAQRPSINSRLVYFMPMDRLDSHQVTGR